MKKAILISLMLTSTISQGASIILGPSVKYGLSGYSVTPHSSTQSTTSGHGEHRSVTTTNNNTVDVTENKNLVYGITLQTVPDTFGVSLGAGYYFDGSATLSLGIGL